MAEAAVVAEAVAVVRTDVLPEEEVSVDRQATLPFSWTSLSGLLLG